MNEQPKQPISPGEARLRTARALVRLAAHAGVKLDAAENDCVLLEQIADGLDAQRESAECLPPHMIPVGMIVTDDVKETTLDAWLEGRLTGIERRLDALEQRPENAPVAMLAQRTTELRDRLDTLERHPVLEPEPVSG